MRACTVPGCERDGTHVVVVRVPSYGSDEALLSFRIEVMPMCAEDARAWHGGAQPWQMQSWPRLLCLMQQQASVSLAEHAAPPDFQRAWFDVEPIERMRASMN